jgi:hypothetical protein
MLAPGPIPRDKCGHIHRTEEQPINSRLTRYQADTTSEGRHRPTRNHRHHPALQAGSADAEAAHDEPTRKKVSGHKGNEGSGGEFEHCLRAASWSGREQGLLVGHGRTA